MLFKFAVPAAAIALAASFGNSSAHGYFPTAGEPQATPYSLVAAIPAAPARAAGQGEIQLAHWYHMDKKGDISPVTTGTPSGVNGAHGTALHSAGSLNGINDNNITDTCKGKDHGLLKCYQLTL